MFLTLRNEKLKEKKKKKIKLRMGQSKYISGHEFKNSPFFIF